MEADNISLKMFCPFCGQKQGERPAFCIRCGKKLDFLPNTDEEGSLIPRECTPKPKCETLKEFLKFRDFKVEERNQFSKRKLPQKQTSVTITIKIMSPDLQRTVKNCTGIWFVISTDQR